MAPGTFRAAAASAVHSGGSFGGIDSQAQQHADPGGSRNAQSSGVGVAEKYGLLAAVIAARGGCAVLDGGLATELELRGADLNDPLWSAKCLMEEEASSLVRKVHLDYYRAGADISISASYQATIEGFTARGLSKGQAEALLARSVQLVGEARDRFWAQYCAEAERRGERVERAEGGVERVAGRVKPLVAASVGSYGAFLADGSEYSGDYGADMTVERLMDFHRRRLQVLAAAGPDIIAMETIPCHIEAQALVQLLEEQAASGAAAVPAWISFNSKDGRTAPSGDLFSSCIATAAASPHVVAVGINCTPPRFILPLLHAARKETSKPLVVYPNSGEAWDGINKEWVVRALPRSALRPSAPLHSLLFSALLCSSVVLSPSLLLHTAPSPTDPLASLSVRPLSHVISDLPSTRPSPISRASTLFSSIPPWALPHLSLRAAMQWAE
ncbi:unnamed protein product [Closterium sp. Naga37s-1]|nr:unnamed protein product [Closterium sp. Naga37s-1]